jgi:hypothetical protein
MRMNCGDKIMIPCEECIALPICINKYKIKCNILKEWLYGDQMLFGINFMDVVTTIFRKSDRENLLIEYIKSLETFYFYDGRIQTYYKDHYVHDLYHYHKVIRLRDIIDHDDACGGNENGI